MNRIAWIWVCAALTACQTPYQELGIGGGVSATQSNDSTLSPSGGLAARTTQSQLALTSLAIAPTTHEPEMRAAISLEDREGTYAVPVQINGVLTEKFIVDSGAAAVMIPADVMRALIRAGAVTDKDFLEDRLFTQADGSKVVARLFRIGTLRVGDVVVQNVVGTVTPANDGLLLLGQSFLRKLKSWSIDNERNMLLIER
jgi:clan AA aspartic protease (TIGR02281 family)